MASGGKTRSLVAPPPKPHLEVFNTNLVVQPSHVDTKAHQGKRKTPIMEKIREFCTHVDVFAAAHNMPVHKTCILVSTGIIPICLVTIIWDLMAVIYFQMPNLSTINTPGFVLFINFIAVPLGMYGYMMEYLMHENSHLAVVGLIAVVVNPILFLVRAMIEYVFDGFRSEEKVYFETFSEGQEAIYPIGLVRYKDGLAYSDSEEGRSSIKEIFGDEYYDMVFN